MISPIPGVELLPFTAMMTRLVKNTVPLAAGAVTKASLLTLSRCPDSPASRPLLPTLHKIAYSPPMATTSVSSSGRIVGRPKQRVCLSEDWSQSNPFFSSGLVCIAPVSVSRRQHLAQNSNVKQLHKWCRSEAREWHLYHFRFRLASLVFICAEIFAKDYLRTNVLILLNSV